jgi:hypothetical protein
MAENSIPQTGTGHPAPHRDRVALRALWFGIAAAPLAWTLQLTLSSSFAGYVCYPEAAPRAFPLWSGISLLLRVISAAAFVIALAGALVSWNSWRQTRAERPGSVHHLMETGDGRTRFMALCGLLISAVFLIALAFGTTALGVVPLCGR